MEYKFNTSPKHNKGYSSEFPNKSKFLKAVKDIVTLKYIVVVSPTIVSSI